MAQKDYIGPTIRIHNLNLVFDLGEVYNLLKKWLTEIGYEITEISYNESLDKEGKKTTTFFWQVDKKLEYYVKAYIEINFMAATKDVTVEGDGEKAGMQEGEIDIKFNAYLKKDVEDEWAMRKDSGFVRFMREIYDRYFIKGKLEQYSDKANEDTQEVISNLRTYLKLRRYE